MCCWPLLTDYRVVIVSGKDRWQWRITKPHNVIMRGWNSAGWETQTLKGAREFCTSAATSGHAKVKMMSWFIGWTVKYVHGAEMCIYVNCSLWDDLCAPVYLFWIDALKTELNDWSIQSVDRISICSQVSQTHVQNKLQMLAWALHYWSGCKLFNCEVEVWRVSHLG